MSFKVIASLCTEIHYSLWRRLFFCGR